MLASEAVRETVSAVLASTLGRDISRLEIEARPDHDGDAALFIKAFFRANAHLPNARSQLEAMALLRTRLLEAGEDRLPYLDLDYPSEQPAGDPSRS